MLDRDTQNVDMLVRTLDVHMFTLRDYAWPSPKMSCLPRFGSFAFGFGPTLRVRLRSSGRVRLRTPALRPLSFCISFCRFDGIIGFGHICLLLLFSISNLFPCLGAGVHRPLAFVFRLSLLSSRLVPFLFLASYGRGERIRLPNSVFA